ncbi:carbohydrate sulfotransferase [Plakobranchus ocellatus]|uniref:Carbohydrate sulfotransferase n=1 Tax=Plakobranchus ocellatus TaxID=259542 RepID=A0AAV4BUG1_9GAST|nr:carbohydrate sulfotransferase [Plakobranchus ocellatus]
MNGARVIKGLLALCMSIIIVILYFKGASLQPWVILPGHHRLSSVVDVSLRDLSRESYDHSDSLRFSGQALQPKYHTRNKFTPKMLKEAETQMKARRDQVHRACLRMGFENTSSPDSGLKLPRALVSINKETVYCPVEKTASTFFRRFVYQLEHTDPMRSPFEVPVKMIYACHSLFTQVEEHAQNLQAKKDRQTKQVERMKKRRKNKNIVFPKPVETIDSFLKRSTNFLFVRDPFSRLFSAYVDKLLAPNPEFWDTWGLFALQKHRSDPSEKSQRCGHDVTFAEFLKFVLDLDLSPPTADPHVRPIFDLCRPCDVDYSVIGFIQTFQRDVVYLSSLLNVTEAQIEFYKMADDTKRDALEDSVMGAFTEWSHRLAQCVTKADIVRRIWRKLQIRGFISARINFAPKMLKDSVEYLDADDFIKVLAKAVDSSTDEDELRNQKMAAMMSAYRTVDLSTLNSIVHLYAADFRAFGFNERPKFIFDRPNGVYALNYSDALDFYNEWVI